MAIKNIKELIEKNEDIEFVFHVQSEAELEELVTALEELDYEYAIPIGTIREMAEDFVSTDGFDGCWRISRERGIAYNPSVEHWKFYVNDIAQYNSKGELEIFEKYTPEQREAERKKLRLAFFEDEDRKYALQLFKLTDATPEEIEARIEELIG